MTVKLMNVIQNHPATNDTVVINQSIQKLNIKKKKSKSQSELHRWVLQMYVLSTF